MSHKYSNLDEKIDKYLGTNNIRPGPNKRLINKNIEDFNSQKSKKIIETKIEKEKINFMSTTLQIKRGIKWEE